MRRRRHRHELRGVIASTGFASGDRFVCGVWERSPIGPMADVMWAAPGGRRRLLVPSAAVGAFVSAVYEFDDVVVGPLEATLAGPCLTVEASDAGLSLEMRAGRRWPIPIAGPAWVTRRLAGPIAWRALRVRTYGVSPTGVREWYRASWYRPLTGAVASLDGRDLGAMAPLDPPVRFGFSEPPRRPSMVWVRPLLELQGPVEGDRQDHREGEREDQRPPDEADAGSLT